MARHNFREIVLIILTLLVGLGILLVIGSRLIYIAVRSATARTGGITVVSGGISFPLFLVAMGVLALVVILAVFLWRR